MKHFFFSDKTFSDKTLDKYWNNIVLDSKNGSDLSPVCLRRIYNMADIIVEMRLEDRCITGVHNHLEFLHYIIEINKDTYIEENDEIEKEPMRIRLLSLLKDYVEEKAKEKNICYYLALGNLCLHLSECYAEYYNFDKADEWNRCASEYFWCAERENGKNKGNVFDYLIQSNIGKCYLNYAERNRRSDYEAAEKIFEDLKKKRCHNKIKTEASECLYIAQKGQGKTTETQKWEKFHKNHILYAKTLMYKEDIKSTKKAIKIFHGADAKKRDHSIAVVTGLSYCMRKQIKYEATVDEINSLLQNKGNCPISTLENLFEELNKYVKAGNLLAKSEIIKWQCLFLEIETNQNYHSDMIWFEHIQNIKGIFVSKGFKGTIDTWRKELESEPKQIQFLFGLLSFREQNYQDAIDIFERIQEDKHFQYIRQSPRTIGLKTRYLCARAYMRQGNLRKAEMILQDLYDRLKHSIKIKDNSDKEDTVDERVGRALACCYVRKGRYEDAIELYGELYEDRKSIFYYIDLYLNQKMYLIIDGIEKYSFKKEIKQEILNSVARCFVFTRRDVVNKIFEKIGNNNVERDLLEGYQDILCKEKDKAYECLKRSFHFNKPDPILFRQKDKLKVRDEVERLSAYIIYCAKNDVNKDIEEFIQWFPHISQDFQISLKAAMALAGWLLGNGDKSKEKEEKFFEFFSYTSIFNERGTSVFDELRRQPEFRSFTLKERGRLLAHLLYMYQDIKKIKEECCFTIEDKKNDEVHLVHYTKIERLRNLLDDTEGKRPRLRISNCGYMNDIFEGAELLNKIKKEKNGEKLVHQYFPSFKRDSQDMQPKSSNVYISSLSVKEDSFPMWSIYADGEKGCNIEFGKRFFDINGAVHKQGELRDYVMSSYTDEDYPIYIVQYLNQNQNSKDEKINVVNRQIKPDDFKEYISELYEKWNELDECLEKFESGSNGNNLRCNLIRKFVADRIDEIRFLFKDADYAYEQEVRVVYTYFEGNNKNVTVKTDYDVTPPYVYVDLEREITGVNIRLGSKIDDIDVDKYVAWLKSTGKVENIYLAQRNRYKS